MSTPVTTDKWAGEYDCSKCGSKRLMATEFSRKMLDKFRQNSSTPLKCQSCVQEQQQQERAASQAAHSFESSNETRVCAKCQQNLSASAYNRNQWNKKDSSSRCRSCVEQAEVTAAQQLSENKETKFQQAQQGLQEAQSSGDSKRILQAESVLAALEAERITGLKPIRMRRAGRGRADELNAK